LEQGVRAEGQGGPKASRAQQADIPKRRRKEARGEQGSDDAAARQQAQQVREKPAEKAEIQTGNAREARPGKTGGQATGVKGSKAKRRTGKADPAGEKAEEGQGEYAPNCG